MELLLPPPPFPLTAYMYVRFGEIKRNSCTLYVLTMFADCNMYLIIIIKVVCTKGLTPHHLHHTIIITSSLSYKLQIEVHT